MSKFLGSTFFSVNRIELAKASQEIFAAESNGLDVPENYFQSQNLFNDARRKAYEALLTKGLILLLDQDFSLEYRDLIDENFSEEQKANVVHDCIETAAYDYEYFKRNSHILRHVEPVILFTIFSRASIRWLRNFKTDILVFDYFEIGLQDCSELHKYFTQVELLSEDTFFILFETFHRVLSRYSYNSQYIIPVLERTFNGRNLVYYLNWIITCSHYFDEKFCNLLLQKGIDFNCFPHIYETICGNHYSVIPFDIQSKIFDILYDDLQIALYKKLRLQQKSDFILYIIENNVLKLDKLDNDEIEYLKTISPLVFEKFEKTAAIKLDMNKKAERRSNVELF